MTSTCEHPNHTPRADDGVEERRGTFLQVRHPVDGWTVMQDGSCGWDAFRCPGVVTEGTVDIRGRKGGRYETAAPCQQCRPGLRAVWFAGLGRVGWEGDPQARGVFRVAEGRWPTWYNSRGVAQIDKAMPSDEAAPVY